MNYAPKNNSPKFFQSSRTRSGISVPMKVVIVAVSLLVVLYVFFPRALPRFFLAIVAPVWKANLDAKFGSATREELQKMYLELENNSKKNDILFKENEELKAGLGRAQETQPLLASILKKPPYSAYDSFIVDTGSNHGVKIGNKVYTLGGIPVGIIAEVHADISRVRLYSSLGEKFNILIGPSHIEAVASGMGGGYFELSLPRDTKIKIGDSVKVPQLSDSYVGTVDGIVSEPSEPFARIHFRQPFSMYEERWVIIDTHVTN